MSMTTFDRVAVAESTAASATWPRRLWTAFVAAREAQAERVVRTHLTRLDDARLAQLGFTGTEIKALRTGKPLPRVTAS